MSCSSQPPFNAYNLEYTNLIIFKKQSTNKMMITQKRLRAVDPGRVIIPMETRDNKGEATAMMVERISLQSLEVMFHRS
jgi:hypothetical protein